MYPLSEACERNKGPILGILTEAFASRSAVLEIGSGTGQHARHFATHLPHLSWQPTDTDEYLAGLRARLATDRPSNLRDPIELDVRQPWPPELATLPVDALFTANTLHIMGWSTVEAFFGRVGTVMPVGGIVCIYGPFRYDGRYTSPSNADFDRFLQTRDPDSGIRAFEAVDALAQREGLELVADHSMPANNQLLVWHKQPPGGQR